MRRSVRWYEARQDRVGDTVERLSRRARRLVDRGDGASAVALLDRLRGLRAMAARYGRAKARIGTYDPTYGWRDAA